MNTAEPISGINYDALRKGDYLSPAEIERICGVPVADDTFRLELLKLKKRIEDYFKEHRDLVVTMRIDANGLRICTDSEAVPYNESQFDAGFRRMRNAYRRTAGIVRDNLTADERHTADRNQRIQGATILAASQARRSEAQAVPVKRRTPGLNGSMSS